MKPNCVSCGMYMGFEEERYNDRGNFCMPCVMKVNEGVASRMKKAWAWRAIKEGRAEAIHLKIVENLPDKKNNGV